jgi:MFS transporter, ACS family, tartrate transporter
MIRWRGSVMQSFASHATAAASVGQEELVRAGARKATARLLPLLAVGYLVSYIDRTNIGFAALTMNQALGLTATQFGVAAGAFYIGYVLLEVPSNLVLRRVGARRWLARIMITWGLAAAGTALARGPHSLYLLRVITGAAEAGFYPGVIFYLSTWFPQQYRARAFGWFNLANPMASVVSGPVSAALLHLSGAGGLAGWQWLFILEGLPACLLGLYTLYFLPDRPSAVSWLSAEEQAATAAVLAAEHHPGVTTELGAALRDRRVVILTISYFCLIVGVLGVTLWLPLMLKQHGLSTNAIGWNTAWPYLMASIGLIVWSAHLDRTRKFLKNYIACCFLAAAGFALSVSFDSLPLTLSGIALALIGMNACRPAFFSILPCFLGGAAAAGGIAFINAVGNLGGFVGPYMVGWLKDWTGSFRAGMLALAAMLVAAGVTALLLKLNLTPGPALRQTVSARSAKLP